MFAGIVVSVAALIAGHGLLIAFLIYVIVGVTVCVAAALASSFAGPEEQASEGESRNQPDFQQYRADYEYWYKQSASLRVR